MATSLGQMTWDQVSADPRYTSANPQQKYNIEKAWRASQAPAPQEQAQPSPAPQQTAPQAPQQDLATKAGNAIANFGTGAVAGIGQAIGHGVAGTVEAVEDTLGTGSTYGKRMRENTDKQYAMDMAGTGKAGRYGATAGKVAGDIGAMVAAPEVAIPAIAAREFGEAYGEQAPGEKSLGRAAAVGGANYLAGKILPGATSEVAEGLIGKGIQAATRIAKGAGAGAAGGGAVGMAEELNANPEATVGETIGAGLRSAATGAAFGATIGAAHEVVGSVTNRTAKAAEEVTQDIPPVEKADLTDQATKVAQAQTPQEKADAYKNSAGLRSVKGSTALDARGIPLTDARLGYSEEAMTTHGKSLEDVQASRDASREGATNAMYPWTNTEAPGKMAVAKSQWEKGGRQLVDDVKGSLESGETAINQFKRTIEEDIQSRSGEITPAERSANRQQLAQIDTFGKDYAKYKSAMTNLSAGESVRSENLLDLAAKAEDSYNALPDYFKEQFNSEYKDIGEGFQKGFSPVDHAATYIDSFNQLKEMHPNFRNSQTKPSQGAVKGVQGTSAVDLGTAALRAFKAGKARNAMLNEQAAAASQVRSLAAGLANAERRSAASVESAKAAMENPVVDDSTQDQMQYSNETPAAAPAPQPDQMLTRTPRQPVQPEPEVAPETTVTEEAPAPAPQPDQLLTQQPRQPQAPVEEAPAPVEQAPVEEPTPAPQPDQILTQRPTQPQAPEAPAPVEPQPEPERLPTTQPARPAEPAVEEPAPEAPVEPQEAPKPEPDQALARTPKAPEKAAEEAPAAPEPAETEPKTKVEPENASAFERHKAAVKEKAVNLVKKMFSVKEVQDKVTPENYNDKRAIDRLKKEDAAKNVEDINHNVDQLAAKKKQADARNHENNMKELDDWSKEHNIDQKFITEAIAQKGLQKSNILGVNDIKVRATKLAVEAAKPAKATAEPVEEKTPVNWKDQRDQFRDGLKELSPEARGKAAQFIEQAFRASEKTDRALTESDVHGLWSKIYNADADAKAKIGKVKEADEAKAKAEKAKADEEAISNAKKSFQEKQATQEAENSKIRDQLKLNEQTDDIRKQIVKNLTESKVPEDEANSVADRYMDDNFGVLRSSMTDVKYNSNRAKAIEHAKKYGKDYEKMNPAEKVEAVYGADEVTKAAKEAFAKAEERVKNSDVDKAEAEDNLAELTIDRAEKAFRDGDSVADADAAADVLAKAYGLDETAAYSIRRYPKILAKAQAMKEAYPNNPEVWLTQTDVNSLAKAGRVNADGMKAKITDTVIGKRYDSVKLLTEKEAEVVRKRLDKGEEVKGVKIDKGRRGALGEVTEQSAKPKVRVRKGKAGVWNRTKK